VAVRDGGLLGRRCDGTRGDPCPGKHDDDRTDGKTVKHDLAAMSAIDSSKELTLEPREVGIAR
jgi:hypothetical protein